jgi:CBS domain-containing protein
MTARSDTAAAVAAHRDQSHRESDITPVSPPRPRRLLVEDVMSREVVTVPPSATFHQMIGLMRRYGVSALPVVGDDGALLGIVSEADLLLKETPPSPRRRWVPEGGAATTRRRKADGVVAADVMSAPPISVGSRAPLAAAARLLQEHQIKRLVALDSDDHMVGIVSRRDLLAGFSRSDAEIRSDVIDGVIRRWLMADPADVRVNVDGGVVRLEGIVDRRTDAEILVHMVRGLDGVVEVESAVDYRWDDRDVALSRELHTD